MEKSGNKTLAEINSEEQNRRNREMAENYARLNKESIVNGVLRNVLINLKETQPLQSHDYMIIEDEDYKGKIIDVGSGPGVTSIVSKLKNPTADITMMDGSQINLELASTMAMKVGLTHNDLTLILGLVGDKINDKYDTVVMSHVLEHIEDTENAINWLIDLTNPDGTIFIAVPYKDCHWSPDHVHYFRTTKDADEGMLNKVNKTTDLEKIMKDMGLDFKIAVFDMNKVDERQPYDCRGQLDMLIKIKVEK